MNTEPWHRISAACPSAMHARGSPQPASAHSEPGDSRGAMVTNCRCSVFRGTRKAPSKIGELIMKPIPANPSRVLFYGVTGSGKSSAAHLYAAASGLPEFSADDDIGWLPGWQQRSTEQQREIAADVAARDRWVLDSAYGVWRDIVVPRAELVVALDYPRWLSLSRLAISKRSGGYFRGIPSFTGTSIRSPGRNRCSGNGSPTRTRRP